MLNIEKQKGFIQKCHSCESRNLEIPDQVRDDREGVEMTTGGAKGFTLVELAIVLVIVGLLIGGVLKGQQLLINSRVTATVAQIKAIEAATTSFRDSYGGLPGDLKNSSVKVSGCSTGVGVCDDWNSDGAIGETDWDMATYQPTVAGASACSVGASDTCDNGNETLLFWYSLEKSGLITAVTDAARDATPTAFGKSVPAAKIGGGFWVGNSLTATGVVAGRNVDAGKYTLLGPIITLVPNPATNLTFGKKAGPLTPDLAANIDRKLDDGMPERGSVQAWGANGTTGQAGSTTVNASCYGSGTTSFAYQEGVKDQDCGVHIRIQK